MRQILLFCCLLLSGSGFAQFKVTVAAGYAVPTYQEGTNQLSKAGFMYSVEPQYELGKHLEVGVRFEQAFIQRPEFIDQNITFLSKATSTLSGLLTANYVITSIGEFKPYVGVGGGVYYVAASEQTRQQVAGAPNSSYPLPTTINLGGVGRVGVKYRFIHLEADYNLIGDTSVKNSATGLTLTAKNSYFGVRAGVTIGGKK